VTSAAFSPDFDSNIAIAMVSTRISRDEEYIEVLIEGEWRMAVCSTLPFTKAN
jgi:glycine cleavage system aminomethyltransferase T